MQDTITKEITVKTSKEKVYAALTQVDQITQWFPDQVEGSLIPGEQPIMIFTEENHKSRLFVEAATPHEYFAYRWVPGGQGTLEDVRTVPNTLVEFFIVEDTEGTKVTVKESGFSTLPSEVAENSFNQNSGGWNYMLGRLEEFMNK